MMMEQLIMFGFSLGVAIAALALIIIVGVPMLVVVGKYVLVPWFEWCERHL